MAEATITDLILTVREENEKSRDETKKNTSQIITLNKTFSDYFTMLKRQALDAEESRRDTKAASGAGAGATAAITPPDKEGGGFLGILAGILLVLPAFIVGVIEGFKDAFTLIFRTLGKGLRLISKTVGFVFNNTVGRFLKGLTKVFRSNFLLGFGNVGKRTNAFGKLINLRVKDYTTFAGKLGAMFGVIVNFVKRMTKSAIFIASVAGVIAKSLGTLAFNFIDDQIIQRIVGLFGRIKGVFSGLARFARVGASSIPLAPEVKTFISGIQSLGNSVRGLLGFGKVAERAADTAKATAGFFSRVGGLFRSLATALGPVLGVFRTLGRVIFFPLTVVMTTFDAIKGAVSGYEEGGYIGGILGALNGIAKGLIALPLDLIKSAIGYIAGFFGLGNVKAALDKFSFEGLFDTIFGSIMKGIEIIGAMFSNLGPATKAAILAIRPGGEGPGEAFSRVLNEGVAQVNPNTSGSEISAQVNDNAETQNGFLAGQSSTQVIDTSQQNNVNITQTHDVAATDDTDKKPS